MKPDVTAQDLRGQTSTSITFSKDIPLKRDGTEAARSDSSIAVQAFLLIIIAVAGMALYAFTRRRRALAKGNNLPAQLSFLKVLRWNIPFATETSSTAPPRVLHRTRLDRQRSLYVIEWHGVEHLVALGDAQASVIASKENGKRGEGSTSAQEVDS